MAIRTSMNISMTPELVEFIQGRVSSGRYHTASEVVREGLRLLEEQERNREAAFDALKSKLQRRAARAEKADPSEFIDGEKVFGEIREMSAVRRQARK